eukprot:TRINITY_DN4979_c0_g1_i1.p1 TRINITY_DN4979_c0_g1~~TRINITY_DN4979_c0_g1_i1.p1  ORF type:complete len:220 (-),score=55.76 TRINITY_DN4979_c0_g1_i1:149-808(-)
MELTGIQQEQVSAAETLPVVLQEFEVWLGEQGLLQGGLRFAIVTWSDADCFAVRSNCEVIGMEVPPHFKQWINLKASYKQHFKREPTGGLKSVVEGLGFRFDGRPHCGLDDARNTGKIAQRLVKEGYRFWRYTRIMLPRSTSNADAAVDAADESQGSIGEDASPAPDLGSLPSSDLTGGKDCKHAGAAHVECGGAVQEDVSSDAACKASPELVLARQGS